MTNIEQATKLVDAPVPDTADGAYELHVAFHKLWSTAPRDGSYAKREWMHLDERLSHKLTERYGQGWAKRAIGARITSLHATQGDSTNEGGTEVPTGVHDLRFLQVSLPWSPNYSQDFRSNPQSHKDFAHAVLHIVKAAGNLATICEDWDHHRPDANVAPRRAEERAAAEKALADVVICALRAASVCPGGSIDLGQSVVDRIETKNSVKLRAT